MARHNSVLVSRSLYQMGVVTLVAAIVWVAVGVYLSVTKTVTIEVDKSLTEPLSTKLDTEVIEQLATRLKVEGEVSVGTESAILEEDELTN